MKYDANDVNWNEPYGFFPKSEDTVEATVCGTCTIYPPHKSFPLFFIYLLKILKFSAIISVILYSGKLATTCYNDVSILRLLTACLLSPFYILYIFVTMPDKCISALPAFIK